MSTPSLVLHSPDESQPITYGRLLDFSDDPVACMRALKARHGNVSALEDNGQRIYFVFGPQFNHQVLSDAVNYHANVFAIRGSRNSPQRRLSSGLLSMNGEQHKRQRRLVMEAFQKKALVNYVAKIQQACEQMLSTWRPGTEIDINSEMTSFMLRLSSTILFGIDDGDQAVRVGEMIDKWAHMNHELGMGAFVADQNITNRYHELLELAAELEAEFREMIRQRRAIETGRDALSLMINANDDEGSISNDELIGQAALMFGAAHLTTAHTLAWTLFLLAEHPSVMTELHHEYTTHLDGGFPHQGQLDRLTRTEHVIKESMRVLPASSYSPRVTAAPTQLGPFSLPPSSGIVFSQFITHHMAELFPNPDHFIPDRWKTINPSPYEYLPFGAGPRMCIGASLAMLILKSALPTILQRFKLTAVPMSEVSGKVISTMLCPTTTMMMRLDSQDGKFESQPVVGNIHDMVELGERNRSSRKAA